MDTESRFIWELADSILAGNLKLLLNFWVKSINNAASLKGYQVQFNSLETDSLATIPEMIAALKTKKIWEK